MKRLALLVAVGTLAAAPAPAAELAANIGLGYSHTLTLPQDMRRLIAQALLQQYQLSASGSPLAPGLFNYKLQAAYSNVKNSQPETKLTSDNLTFNGNVGLLQQRLTPVTLTARRTKAESASSVRATEFLGETTITNFGGSIGVQSKNTPLISAGVDHSLADTENTFGQKSHTERTNGRLSLTQATRRLRYEILGRATSSRGDRVASAYDSQYLTLSQVSDLTDDLRFSGRGALFRRRAANDEVGNPNYLSSAVGLDLQAHHTERLSSLYGYSYARFGRTGTGTADLDSTNHNGRSQIVYRLNPVWNLRGGAAVANTTDIAPGATYQTWSESLLTGADARKEFAYLAGLLGLTGRVGLAHPRGGKPGLAYGIDGDIGASTEAITDSSLTADLRASWSEDRSSQRAHELRQAGSIIGSTTALRHTRLNLLLSGEWALRKRANIESSSQKGATLQLGGQWRDRIVANLTGQYHDGASSFVENPIDPLAVPQEYNVVTESLTGTVTALLLRSLQLAGRATHARITSRVQRQRRDTVELRLDYRIGLLTFSAWDRLIFEKGHGQSTLANTFFVLASRSFALGIR